MTISTTANKDSYTGNGSQTAFTYNFRILDESEIQVYDGGTLQTITTHYTVSGVGDATGTVTFVTAPANSNSVVLIRNTTQTQLTDYVANDPFPAEAHEAALDRLTMIAQDVQVDANAAFRFADTVTDAGTITITENATDRASKVLAFDSSGGLTANQELGEHQGNWATATAYVLRDIVTDSSNSNQYICITAHTSTGTTPISSNADVAKWRLIVDAASASTSETNAANSASAASTSETNAATSETNAAASAASAASYATTLSATQTYYTSGGSSNAYTITATPTLAAYAAGVTYIMKANHANTGPATLNVDGVGAKTINKNDGTALSAGDIPNGGVVLLTYDGTNFQLVGGAQTSSSDQVLINTLDIFANTIGDMADHSDNVLNTVDGFTDDFQDGSTQNNTALDISDTSGDGITHDNTNKLWKNTAGATNQNADQDFTTESNYDTFDLSGTDCSISGDTVTINAGNNFVDNKVLYARFSPENPFNPANSANIATYTSTTSVDLDTGHGLTATNSAWTVRFFEISSGVAQLAVGGGVGYGPDVTSGETPTTNNSISSGAIGNVIDDNTGTNVDFGQTDALPRYVKIQFASAKTITKAVINVNGVEGRATSVSFNIKGSNDDSTWSSALHSETGYNFASGSGSSDTFTFSNTTAYTYYRIEWTANTNSNQGLPTWYETEMMEDAASNVINKYTPVFPTYANLADASSWSDENSMAQTETLNSANIYYGEIFATASYGAGSIIKISDGATNNIRTIAVNTAGTWQYNSNATYGSQTLTNATSNSMAQALIDAMGVAANQMTGTNRAATTDAATLLDTAKKRGTVAILYSTNTSNNPNVSQTRVNYDSVSANADLQNRAFGGTNMPPVPASNVATLVLLAIDKQISGTPTYEVSSNGGTDWTTVSSWDIEDLQANGYTNRLAEVTVSGQTAPRTNPRFRIRNGGTGESYELKAVGLKYK